MIIKQLIIDMMFKAKGNMYISYFISYLNKDRYENPPVARNKIMSIIYSFIYV